MMLAAGEGGADRAGAVAVVVVVLGQLVGEKEQLENQEDDGQLNQDYGPEPAPHGHLPEAPDIQVPDPREKALRPFGGPGIPVRRTLPDRFIGAARCCALGVVS